MFAWRHFEVVSVRIAVLIQYAPRPHTSVFTIDNFITRLTCTTNIKCSIYWFNKCIYSPCILRVSDINTSKLQLFLEVCLYVAIYGLTQKSVVWFNLLLALVSSQARTLTDRHVMELPLASAKHQWKTATVAMVIGTDLVVGMVLASNCGSKLCPSRMHARPLQPRVSRSLDLLSLPYNAGLITSMRS